MYFHLFEKIEVNMKVMKYIWKNLFTYMKIYIDRDRPRKSTNIDTLKYFLNTFFQGSMQYTFSICIWVQNKR